MIHQQHFIGGESLSIFTVESKADFATVLSFVDRPGPLAFDTESTGIDVYAEDWNLRTFQFGDTRTAFVVPVEFKSLVTKVLFNRKRRWVAHNAAFDVRALDQWLGYSSGLLDQCLDTYLYAHLLDSRSKPEGGTGHDLKSLCDVYVSKDASEGEKKLKAEFKQLKVQLHGEVYKSGKRKGEQKYRKARISEGWRLIDTYNPTYTLYAGLDPILTMRLWRYLKQRVTDRKLLKFEHKLQRECATLTDRGFMLDVDYATRLSEEMGWEVEDHELWADWHGCTDVNSPAKVGAALKRNGAKLTEKTPKGQDKVDSKVLQSLQNSEGELGELVFHILEAKRKAKRKTSYVDCMLRVRDRENRVHAIINSLRARTARQSVSYPPLQQLPAREWLIRRCLVAYPGLLIVAADLDQVEMRVAAAFAGETRMIQAAKRGESIHKVVATQVFGENYDARQYTFAKNLGFGTVYGGGAATLARQAEVSIEDARSVLSLFRVQFPRLAEWKRDISERILREALSDKDYRAYQSLRQRLWDYDPHTEEGAQAHKYLKWRMEKVCAGKTGTIVTPIGRHIKVDAAKAYTAVNYYVQSTSRDLLAEGLINIMDDRELARTVLMPVHDEVVGQARRREAKDVAKRYAEHMTTEFMSVPITAQGKVLGRSWGDGYGAPDDYEEAFKQGVLSGM